MVVRRTRIHGKVMEVAVVSLRAREQQALERIEAELAGSDPKLGAMLATFTRLTSDEDMPAGEQVPKARQRRVHTGPRHGPASPGPWLPTAILLIVAALLAVTASLAGGAGSRTCARSWELTCVGTVPPHQPAQRADIKQTGGG
jgi:hypothetical protein